MFYMILLIIYCGYTMDIDEFHMKYGGSYEDKVEIIRECLTDSRFNFYDGRFSDTVVKEIINRIDGTGIPWGFRNSLVDGTILSNMISSCGVLGESLDGFGDYDYYRYHTFEYNEYGQYIPLTLICIKYQGYVSALKLNECLNCMINDFRDCGGVYPIEEVYY